MPVNPTSADPMSTLRRRTSEKWRIYSDDVLPMFVAESDRMTDLIRSLPEEVTFRAGQFGLIATREGFAHGREWLAATVAARINLACSPETISEAVRRLASVTL